MSLIIATGQKTVSRKTYQEALEAAQFIANKHNVPAIIVDTTGSFENEIIKPA